MIPAPFYTPRSAGLALGYHREIMRQIAHRYWQDRCLKVSNGGWSFLLIPADLVESHPRYKGPISESVISAPKLQKLAGKQASKKKKSKVSP